MGIQLDAVVVIAVFRNSERSNAGYIRTADIKDDWHWCPVSRALLHVALDGDAVLLLHLESHKVYKQPSCGGLVFLPHIGSLHVIEKSHPYLLVVFCGSSVVPRGMYECHVVWRLCILNLARLYIYT